MTALDTIKSAVLGVPFDPEKKPSRQGVVRAFSEMQTQLEAAQAGAFVRDTKANLNLLLAAPISAMAWVVNDPTTANNGIYQNTGSAVAAVWTRRADIPQFFITGMNTGEGTADAIKITTDKSVPSQDGRAMIAVPIIANNTISPPTVSINGDAALPIITNSGVDVAIGGLLAGMYVVGFITAGKFRLITNQVDAAIVAAAEAAAAEAEAAASSISYRIFKNRADLISANVPSSAVNVTTLGYYNELDQGGADWVLVPNTGPLETYQCQSNSGTKRWEMIGDKWNIRQFGAIADGRTTNTDNATAIQNAVDAVIKTRRGELHAPGGSYGIGSTILVSLTDKTIETLGVTLNLVGAGSDATEFFWLADNNNAMFNIVGPSDTSGSNLGGVQNLHWRGFSGHMLHQGKGTFISTQFIGHSKFEDIYSLEFDLHWQIVDGLVLMFDRVRASYGRRGFWAYKNSFTFPNAFTFIACTFGGMHEWGIIGEGVSGWVFDGGSIEGNGTSVSYPVRGGLRAISPGNEGGLTLVIDGTYFEYNGGQADINILANPSFASLSKIAGIFNRGSSAGNAVHNVYVETDTGYGPVDIDYTGSSFAGLDGYIPSGSRLRLNKVGSGPVRFYGSGHFTDAVESPQNADTAPIAEAQFNSDGTITRSSNVSAVTKNAAGDFTISLIKPKRNEAYIEFISDGALICSKFSEDVNFVRLRFFNTASVTADPPTKAAVRIFA